MSIIEEALRRVQGPVTKTTRQAAPNVQTPSATSVAIPAGPLAHPEPPPAHSWTPIPPVTAPALPRVHAPNLLLVVALTMMALTIGLISIGTWWFIRWHPIVTPADSPVPIAPSASAASAPAQAAPPPAVVAPKPAPPLRLSGVVEATDTSDSYAVINNEIVAVGERVGDATLLAIAHGAVTMRRDDGEELVLRVSRTR